MAKKSKKLTLTPVLLGTLAASVVGVVLSVIGVIVDFIKVTGTVTLGSSASDYTEYTLGEIAEKGSESDMFAAMNAFAYITLVLAILSFVCFAASCLIRDKRLSFGSAGIGALTLVSTVLLLVFTLLFCSDSSASITVVVTASAEYSMAAGAILSLIGGLLTGAAAVSALRK